MSHLVLIQSWVWPRSMKDAGFHLGGHPFCCLFITSFVDEPGFRWKNLLLHCITILSLLNMLWKWLRRMHWGYMANKLPLMVCFGFGVWDLGFGFGFGFAVKNVQNIKLWDKLTIRNSLIIVFRSFWRETTGAIQTALVVIQLQCEFNREYISGDTTNGWLGSKSHVFRRYSWQIIE